MIGIIRRLRILLSALTLTYWISLFIIPLLYGGAGGIISIPYLWEVIFLLVYTFPFYIAFLTLGSCIIFWIFKSPQYTKGEEILNIISCAIACLIFSMIFNIERHLFFALTFSIFLILLRIITMVAYKKPIGMFSFMKQKLFWLYTALILLIISIIVFLANNKW